jgi:hypothetical protein
MEGKKLRSMLKVPYGVQGSNWNNYIVTSLCKCEMFLVCNDLP